MNFENFLKFISSNLQYITIIIVFATMYIVKPLRKWISAKIKQIIGFDSICTKLDEINKRIDDTNIRIDNMVDINKEQNIKIENIEKKTDEHIKDDEINKNIQKIQLKNELQQILITKIKIGHVTVEEKQSIQELYDAYKSRKGNSVIDHLWDKFLNLSD